MDTLKSYTRGLRIPSLVGKFQDGTRIPGGPYTMVQLAGFAVVIVVGVLVADILPFGWTTNRLIVVAAAFATAFALARVPVTGRNPAAAAFAAVGLITNARAGRIDGRAVRRLPRAHRVTARRLVVMGPSVPPSSSRRPDPVSDDPSSLPAPSVAHPTSAPAPAEVAAAAASPPLTGVTAALVAASARRP